MCQSLTSTSSCLFTNALAHGKNYEGKAILCFEEKFGFSTSKAGFFISKSTPYLGASPDALVGSDSLVEVKCPYTGRNEKIFPGKNFKFLTYESGNIVLKTNSNYYYQVQGQLYVCQKKFCYFVVYTFCDLFVQKISIDEEYCTGALLPKLELFYKKYLRPFIASTL